MSDFLDLQGAKDLNTDAIHIGAVSNSKDSVTGAQIDTHVNRVGGTDYTLRGFWNSIGPVVMTWTSVVGGTLTQPNQAFLHPANGNYYSWTGAFPKVVTPGENPESTTGYSPRTDLLLRPVALESLRRSYAEAGYNLVQGSFEKGGVLTSASDVLLHEASGKAYSWTGAYPSGGYVVAPNTDPTTTGFNRIDIYSNLRVDSIDELRSLSGLTKGQTVSLVSFHAGWAAVAKPPIGGGDFVVDTADTTSADNGGTVIICTGGVRVKRITNGLNKPEWFGAKADGATDDTIAFSKALNSNPTRLDLCGGKTYRILNVRIPYAESTVIEGNNATVKIASISRVGEHDCCLWYSNIASIGDTLRSTDNNTMTVNNLNFASDAGIGGVGFRYIVANHLTLNECKTSGYLAEGVRVGACNDIHFENCNLGGDTAVRCIYNKNDPYSASFADVSFNDGVYVNGGTVFGNNIGIDYEGSSAEGVVKVSDVVLIGSSVAGIRAANFRNIEVSGCWTEFYKAGSSQILLVADGAGVESDIAHIHNNFFTSYDFQSAGHIPSNIIKSSAHSCVIEDNYFQLQSMPTEAVINFNSGNAAATFKRTHVAFTDVNSGTQAYGICSYEHFGDGQMILSDPEFYGIITDSAGNKFVARVAQTTSTGMKMAYHSYNEVFENFANPISDIPTNFRSSSAGFILKDTLTTKLVNGYGTFEPFLGNGASATTIIGRNTFIMSTDASARNKLFKVTFGDMRILPTNKYILV